MILPYVSMGYRMIVKKSLGYSPYYVPFGRHPNFQAKIQDMEDQPMPDTDDPEAVRLFLDEKLGNCSTQGQGEVRRVRGGVAG